MSAGMTALLIAMWVALAVIVSLVFGAVARTMGNVGDKPAGPVDVHALGHRASRWTSCILLCGALTMLALEQWA
jgi:hypothetical protein